MTLRLQAWCPCCHREYAYVLDTAWWVPTILYYDDHQPQPEEQICQQCREHTAACAPRGDDTVVRVKLGAEHAEIPGWIWARLTQHAHAHRLTSLASLLASLSEEPRVVDPEQLHDELLVLWRYAPDPAPLHRFHLRQLAGLVRRWPGDLVTARDLTVSVDHLLPP